MIFHLLKITAVSQTKVQVAGIQIGGIPPVQIVVCETPENAAVEMWNQNRKKAKETILEAELFEVNLNTSMLYRKEIPVVHFMTGKGIT